MVTQLINSALLSVIEASVNSILLLDPLSQNKLEKLSGKTLQVHCELPEIIVNILICDDKFIFTQGDAESADTEIRGRASALLKLISKRSATSLRDDGIRVKGNVGLLTDLQEIMKNMNVDWEFQLSKIIGDIPTQVLRDGISRAQVFTEHTIQSLKQDIDDYVHEEKELLPSNEELTNFYQSVDNLRLRLDRLEIRAKKLDPLLNS